MTCLNCHYILRLLKKVIHTAESRVEIFDCPHCGAEYRVIQSMTVKPTRKPRSLNLEPAA